MSSGVDQRRRLGLLGAAVLGAAAIVVVLILVSSGGGEGGGAGRPIEDAGTVNRLFDGVPQSGLTLGKPDAPVTMVEFADLQCPFCADYAITALPEIVQRYVRTGKVKLELRLIAIIGPDSGKARKAAAAAALQNRLWNYSELFYRNQGQENSGYVTDPFLRSLASAVPGLDAKRVMSERTGSTVRRQLGRNDALAGARSVDSTPSFFAGRSGQSLAPLKPSSLSPSSFTGPLDQLLGAR
jgi:hypothetical protein